MRGRQRRSLQAIIAMTEVSNTQTAGQTLKQNHRITGESRRQTHSLFRSEKTFGINSPNKMVRNVSGITTTTMARISAASVRQPELPPGRTA